MRNGFFLFLLAIFVASLALSQSTTTKPKKTTPASKSSSAKKSKSSKKSVKAASTAWQPRQSAPTPERYREIQQALVDKGYLKSEPSGVWDAQSVEALRQFQTDRKLSVTGKISSASLIGLGLGPKHDDTQPVEVPPAPATIPPPATPEN